MNTKNFNTYITHLAALLLFACAIAGCSAKSGKGLGANEAGGLSDQDLELSGKRFGDGNIPIAGANRADGLFEDIHFDYDSSLLLPEYHNTIKRDAKALAEDPSLRVEVEGHCDKRGTNEYNLALGGQRARGVAELLVSFGAKTTQVSTISYGEEIPLDQQDVEEAYAKNRRVHFAIYRDGA